MSTSPPDSTAPSILWYRRFCFNSPLDTIRRQAFTEPYDAQFMQLCRSASTQVARAWLFGAILDDVCRKADAMRAAMQFHPPADGQPPEVDPTDSSVPTAQN